MSFYPCPCVCLSVQLVKYPINHWTNLNESLRKWSLGVSLQQIDFWSQPTSAWLPQLGNFIKQKCPLSNARPLKILNLSLCHSLLLFMISSVKGTLRPSSSAPQMSHTTISSPHKTHPRSCFSPNFLPSPRSSLTSGGVIECVIAWLRCVSLRLNSPSVLWASVWDCRHTHTRVHTHTRCKYTELCSRAKLIHATIWWQLYHPPIDMSCQKGSD